MLDQSLDTIKKQTEAVKKDIGGYYTPERRQERKERRKENWSKFTQKIKDKSKPFGKTTRKLITNTGKFIETHSDEIGYLTNTLVGLTIGELFAEQNKENQKVVIEYTDELKLISEFNDIAQVTPEELTNQHWRGYIANVSAVLETQLRFCLNTREDMRLNNLIGKAKKKKIIDVVETKNLHQFRKVRNSFIHSIQSDMKNPDIVVWTGNFVRNFDAETIQEIQI